MTDKVHGFKIHCWSNFGIGINYKGIRELGQKLTASYYERSEYELYVKVE